MSEKCYADWFMGKSLGYGLSGGGTGSVRLGIGDVFTGWSILSSEWKGKVVKTTTKTKAYNMTAITSKQYEHTFSSIHQFCLGGLQFLMFESNLKTWYTSIRFILAITQIFVTWDVLFNPLLPNFIRLRQIKPALLGVQIGLFVLLFCIVFVFLLFPC